MKRIRYWWGLARDYTINKFLYWLQDKYVPVGTVSPKWLSVPYYWFNPKPTLPDEFMDRVHDKCTQSSRSTPIPNVSTELITPDPLELDPPTFGTGILGEVYEAYAKHLGKATDKDMGSVCDGCKEVPNSKDYPDIANCELCREYRDEQETDA